jgi:hypothetical protein
VSSRAKLWLVVVAAVVVGAVLTWLAFGYGVQEKPVPDLTDGVELVQPRDRSAR